MSAINLGSLYPVVRSYALKGMLLEYSVYEDLANSKSLGELVDKLRPTVYGNVLTELPKPLTSENLEKIFQTNLIEVEYSLIRYIPKAIFLKTYFLRHVYRNLKTILKARALGIPYEEVSPKINLRAEEHLKIRDLVVKALVEKDLETTIESLKGTQMYPDLKGALEVYEKEKDPLIFETSLDRSFYEQLLRALKKTKRDERNQLLLLLVYEIDGYILTAALRSRLWNLTPAETRKFMLSSGIKFSNRKIEKVIHATNIEEVLKELEDTYYEDVLKIVDLSRPLETINSIDSWFKEEAVKNARRAFLQSVFKLAIVYSFIKLKEVEVRNLTSIAFGVEYGLTPSEILEPLRKVI
ncbi:MAG: V-type ATPase subunit [Nitrososphaerota archaeon]